MISRVISRNEKPIPEGETARLVLARNLREARKRAGVTQRTLSASSGVDQSHISKIELAVHPVNIDTIEKLATTLGVTMSFLFDATAYNSEA